MTAESVIFHDIPPDAYRSVRERLLTVLMGQVGVTGGVRIGDRAVVFGKSGVIGHVPEDGRYMGYPAWSRSEWLRAHARLRHGSRAGPAMPDAGQ